jgi:hypothetical protein
MKLLSILKRNLAVVIPASIILFMVAGISISFAALTLSGTSVTGDSSTAIDAAGTLSIGTSSSTAITIGSSGITTSFPGAVAITATTTIQNLKITGLASSGNPCLIIGGTGAVATSTCASGGGSTRTWSYMFGGTTQGGATGFALNLPSATAPTLTNSGGTVPMPVLEWPTGQSTYYAWATFLLPPGYVTNAAISYSFEYRSADSSHAAILTPSIACVGTSGALDNPTFGAGSTVNLTANASSHQTITSGTWTPNTGSFPSCAAGQRIWIKLLIDTNTNSMTQPFDLGSATFSVTGSM